MLLGEYVDTGGGKLTSPSPLPTKVAGAKVLRRARRLRRKRVLTLTLRHWKRFHITVLCARHVVERYRRRGFLQLAFSRMSSSALAGRLAESKKLQALFKILHLRRFWKKLAFHASFARVYERLRGIFAGMVGGVGVLGLIMLVLGFELKLTRTESSVPWHPEQYAQSQGAFRCLG